MTIANCLCGHVSISCEKVNRHFTTCHCNMCRRWGGLWMATECSGTITITGQEKIAVYDSSTWAERAFCTSCGTHLYYKVKREPQLYIPVGLFEKVDDFVFSRQIFFDHKPDYYGFENKTANYNSEDIPLADPPDA